MVVIAVLNTLRLSLGLGPLLSKVGTAAAVWLRDQLQSGYTHNMQPPCSNSSGLTLHGWIPEPYCSPAQRFLAGLAGSPLGCILTSQAGSGSHQRQRTGLSAGHPGAGTAAACRGTRCARWARGCPCTLASRWAPSCQAHHIRQCHAMQPSRQHLQVSFVGPDGTDEGLSLYVGSCTTLESRSPCRDLPARA